jgi:hypothetical protein
MCFRVTNRFDICSNEGDESCYVMNKLGTEKIGQARRSAQGYEHCLRKSRRAQSCWLSHRASQDNTHMTCVCSNSGVVACKVDGAELTCAHVCIQGYDSKHCYDLTNVLCPGLLSWLHAIFKFEFQSSIGMVLSRARTAPGQPIVGVNQQPIHRTIS